jgi:cell wall integrity and stress response component
VVGLVAIAAVVGGIFLFMKNRRKRAIEEEYRRNAAVSSFMAGGKHPPNSSGGGSSFTDMRLDPAVMAQRRMSDGSIADNQDYSRRILKVCQTSDESESNY